MLQARTPHRESCGVTRRFVAKFAAEPQFDDDDVAPQQLLGDTTRYLIAAAAAVPLQQLDAALEEDVYEELEKKLKQVVCVQSKDGARANKRKLEDDIQLAVDHVLNGIGGGDEGDEADGGRDSASLRSAIAAEAEHYVDEMHSVQKRRFRTTAALKSAWKRVKTYPSSTATAAAGAYADVQRWAAETSCGEWASFLLCDEFSERGRQEAISVITLKYCLRLLSSV